MKQITDALSGLFQFAENTFIRYCFIGVINTLSCFCLIFILMYFFSLNYLLSNILGYTVGIMVSFILNKYKNFRSSGSIKAEMPLFFAAFGFSYSANILVLWFAAEILHVDKFFSQIVAGAIYTMIFYFSMRFFVFARRS